MLIKNRVLIDEIVCLGCWSQPCASHIQRDSRNPWLEAHGKAPLFCPLRVKEKNWKTAISKIGSREAEHAAQSVLQMSPVWTTINSYRLSGENLVLYLLNFNHLVLLDLQQSEKAIQLQKEYRRQILNWLQGQSKQVTAELEAAATQQAAAEKTASLSKPLWIRKDESGDTSIQVISGLQNVGLMVEHQGLLPGDTVSFSLYRESSPDRVTTVVGRVGENSADNAAVADWEIPEKLQGQPIEEGECFYFIAKCASKNIQVKSPSIPFSDGEIDTCMIFYSPSDIDNGEEYWIIEEADLDPIIEEVNLLGQCRENLDKARQEKDKALREEKIQAAALELEELLKDAKGDPKQAVKELYAVKKNPKWDKSLKSVIYVRSHLRKTGKVKGYFRNDKDATVRKRLKKARLQAETAPKFSTEFKLKEKFWSWNHEHEYLPDWKISLPGKHKVGETNINVGAEAQFLRFTANADADFEANLKERVLSVGAKGSLRFGIFDGRASGKWRLPDEDGINMLEFLNLTDKGKKLVKEGRQVRLALEAGLNGFTFVGASLSAGIRFPNLDLRSLASGDGDNGSAKPGNKEKEWGKSWSKDKVPQKLTASASASLSGHAGAEVGVGLTLAPQWSDEGLDFSALGIIGLTARGGAGVGAALGIDIGFKDGKFKVEIDAKLVVGMGGGGKLVFELGPMEGFKFIGSLLGAIDYRRIVNISSEAFQTYRDFAVASYKNGGLLDALDFGFVGKVIDLFDWGNEKAPSTDQPVESISFDVCKSAVRDKTLVRASPPEATGPMVRFLMKGADQDFNEGEDLQKEKENTLLDLLEAVRSDHEFKWIVRWSCPDKKVLMKLSQKRGDLEKKEAYEKGINNIKTFITNRDSIRRLDGVLQKWNL